MTDTPQSARALEPCPKCTCTDGWSCDNCGEPLPARTLPRAPQVAEPCPHCMGKGSRWLPRMGDEVMEMQEVPCRHCARTLPRAPQAADAPALEQWYSLSRAPQAADELERLKCDLGDDIREEENPGQDEYAKAFNAGLRKARGVAFCRLDRWFPTFAARPHAPQAADELVERTKVELWFFRELRDEQRTSLFRICGLPIDELNDSHTQKLLLRHVLGTAKLKELAAENARLLEMVNSTAWRTSLIGRTTARAEAAEARADRAWNEAIEAAAAQVFGVLFNKDAEVAATAIRALKKGSDK